MNPSSNGRNTSTPEHCLPDASGPSDMSVFARTHPTVLNSSVLFEMRSWLGRLVLNRKPPVLDTEARLLHLGCGTIRHQGWVNADFFGVRFWSREGWPDWSLDLRYPLNCEENYWDGVFCEHTIEHLHSADVLNLLREVHRTLKPNCWFRLVVPDLELYVAYYLNSASADSEFMRWETGAEAIGALTQKWGHRSVWDAKLLTRVLETAGFSRIERVRYGEGTDARIVKDRVDRRWESLYIEAQKT